MKIFEVTIATAATMLVTACDAGASSAASPAADGTVHAGSEARLDRLINPELLGASVAYFEAISGPAKRLDEWTEGQTYREYEVDGCEVEMIAAGQSVQTITYHVTEQCNPDGFGMRFAGKTLGDTAADRFLGGCFEACGRAGNDLVSAEYQGSMAEGALSYRFDAMVQTDAQSERMGAWLERMRAEHGDRYIWDMDFQCDDAQAQEAREATADLQIVSVTVSNVSDMLVCKGISAA